MSQDRNSFRPDMKKRGRRGPAEVARTGFPGHARANELQNGLEIEWRRRKFEDPGRTLPVHWYTRATCQMEAEPRSADRVLLEVRSTGNVEV